MEANNLDGILLMEGTSLNYFTGIRWWGGERMFAMVLPAKGRGVLCVSRHLRKDARASRLPKRPRASSADLRIWQEDESPYQRVAQGLKDRELR